MATTEDKDREYWIGSSEYRDYYTLIWSSDLSYKDKQALDDTAYNITDGKQVESCSTFSPSFDWSTGQAHTVPPDSTTWPVAPDTTGYAAEGSPVMEMGE